MLAFEALGQYKKFPEMADLPTSVKRIGVRFRNGADFEIKMNCFFDKIHVFKARESGENFLYPFHTLTFNFEREICDSHGKSVRFDRVAKWSPFSRINSQHVQLWHSD